MTLRVCGNRTIKTLPGQFTRPTPARVRAAIFNIWQGKIEGCRWLDLCTGSGSMGAEALCRGAQLVIGIEKSSQACAVIQQNWQKIAQPTQQFQVRRGDVVVQVQKLAGQQFDYIYFDPPYASNLYQPVLEAIVTYNLLAPDGELAVEHAPKAWNLASIPCLTVCREKAYGNTALTFYALTAG